MNKYLSPIVLCAIALITAGCDNNDNDFPPVINDAEALVSAVGEEISVSFPSSRGPVLSCEISPALPEGLSINETDCSISGSPSVTSDQTTYTIQASNGDGSASAMFDLTVLAALIKFDVTIKNLTSGQPFSPPIAIAHNAPSTLFTDGEEASVALEELAEGGATDDLAASLSEGALLSYSALEDPLGPAGTSSAIRINIANADFTDDARLSVLTMLVNTNDGFTAVNAMDIGGMAVDAVATFRAPAWDAGTEANSEAAGTMPGPADTAEESVGFDAERTDLLNEVRFHSGVISGSELTSVSDDFVSVLSDINRFDNPVAEITVVRVQ